MEGSHTRFAAAPTLVAWITHPGTYNLVSVQT